MKKYLLIIASFAGFIFAFHAFAAGPVLDATGTIAHFTAVSASTTVIETSTANRILYFVSANNGTSGHLTGVAYNGQALTEIASETLAGFAGIWDLVNPASGSNTLNVTSTGTGEVDSGYISFANAAQSTLPNATNSQTVIAGSGAPTPFTVTATSTVANTYLVSGIYNTGGTNSTGCSPSINFGGSAFDSMLAYQGVIPQSGSVTSTPCTAFAGGATLGIVSAVLAPVASVITSSAFKYPNYVIADNW